MTAHDEMCEGFIAVVKTGQDLTRLRATDDLAEIFAKQHLNKMLRQTTKPPGGTRDR